MVIISIVFAIDIIIIIVIAYCCCYCLGRPSAVVVVAIHHHLLVYLPVHLPPVFPPQAALLIKGGQA